MTKLSDRRIFYVALAASLTLFLISSSAIAQVSGTGVITGHVTDQSGAVVPGVQVTITEASTKAPQTATTNTSGRYIFSFVQPGTYDVTFTKSGFQTAKVAERRLIAGGQVNVNITLQVGAVTQTVEVTVTPGANLQTMNATFGTVLSGSAILNMPILNRDVASLLNYEPMAAPSMGGALENWQSGQVAGAQSDQNTYLLDGGNNTDDLAGDSGYINYNSNGDNFSGAPRGAIPVPAESIEEFRINTNNMTSDFGASGGAQVILATKKGTNLFHGSGYDFFQSGKLNSNSWDNNFFGTKKPNSHSNRFGFDVGGPMLPKMAGGKTFFYFFYEGNRYPRAGAYSAMVPTSTLKNGTLTLRDANNNPVQYNLATSTACGPSGGLPCDPRGIGLNPTIQELWNKYMPDGNSTIYGDGLNTTGFRSNLTFPLSDNYFAGRIDHDFGPKWRWFGSYRYFKESNLSDLQTDIGGLLPGNTLGEPVAAADNPNQPRYFVTGLTATLAPNLTNEFHFSYTRNNWEWKRAGALPQIPGIPAALEPGGESAYALVPINLRTQDARRRLWTGHDYDYRDTVSWIKGNHFIQFGGEAMHQWLHFNRYDNVLGGLTELVYNIGDGSFVNPNGAWNGSTQMLMTPSSRPPICTASVTTNCLPTSEINSWDGYYSMMLGMVYDASVVATRQGEDLKLNPLGTPLASYVTQNVYNLYFSDAWHIRPNWTLNFGLNWGVQLAPVDENGEQMIMVDTSNQPINAQDYVANALKAAESGQVYNPTIGFDPIGKVAGGMKYPYTNYWQQFAPRVSLAYSPRWTGGLLGKLFGEGSTVFRGGYARMYNRNNAINAISNTTLGDGFLQSVSCLGPDMSGTCLGTSQADPAHAFRIGVDGNSVPLSISDTLGTPVLPGVGATPYAILANSQDTVYQPGVSDQIAFSIQKQLKGNTIMEVGYMGRWMEHLYLGMDIGNVPWMIKQGGQSFANAYSNLYMELSKGQPATAQPFFDTALAGSPYCAGYTSCTAAVVDNESGNILTQAVTSLWSDLDYEWTAFSGPALVSSTQSLLTYQGADAGFGNYQAFVAKFEKRTSKGLTVTSNFTYSKALGVNGLSQTYTLANPNNPFDLRTDYGPQYFDRKFTFNLLANYVLPFGQGSRFSSGSGIVNRLIGGWSVSPVYSWASGLPLPFYDGSFQEWGNAWDGTGASMIPLVNTADLSNSVRSGVNTGNTVVGSNGVAGLNLFANPEQVFNSFRPPLVGIDNRTMEAGQLRGQTRWSFDLGLTKNTRITERVNAEIFMQAFNLFNHTQFNDPYLAYNDPADFGVPNNGGGDYQLNAINGNYTRVIQFGVRFYF